MMTEDRPDETQVEGQPAHQSAREPMQTSNDEVAMVRELALRAHPDAVPEMVAGATVAEVMASLEPARAAYQRLAERMETRGVGGAAVPAVPAVPAGSAPRVATDPERLPAAEKIRRGLAARR